MASASDSASNSQSPNLTAIPASVPETALRQCFQWRQAERASARLPLTKVNTIPFWLLQIGSGLCLFWLIRELCQLMMSSTNNLLVHLPYLQPIQLLYRDPTQLLLLVLGGALCLSPWLLDSILVRQYGCQPMTIETLATHSCEAAQLLQNYCHQRHWSLPRLGVLPTAAPLALTYGNLPRTARIVVSQGLLSQLAPDEVATIYASALGQINHGGLLVMSLVVLVSQVPYTIYRLLSQWGDKISPKILQRGAAIIAAIGYGLYYLFTSSALWLSQLRIYHGDRYAVELTGNPNGLTRALLKIAIGIAQEVQQQGHTSWLLESWNLLCPIHYRQGISFGSLYPYSEFEPILAWDCLNPARHWLRLTSSHPLLGERLRFLASIATRWQLVAELNLCSLPLNCGLLPKQIMLQGAPFFGILFGLIAGLGFWFLWQVGFLLRLWSLSWIYDDWSFMTGLLLIGFSIGTFIRINVCFPEISSAKNLQINSNLQQLLANSTNLPVCGQPVQLAGKLLGRRGISNWLGQDLIFHSGGGLIKLSYRHRLGPIGNLLSTKSLHPSNLNGRHLTLTGWFRHGTTAWVDIDSLQTQAGRRINSFHPIWSGLLASVAAIGGAYIIWCGG